MAASVCAIRDTIYTKVIDVRLRIFESDEFGELWCWIGGGENMMTRCEFQKRRWGREGSALDWRRREKVREPEVSGRRVSESSRG
jgi:hypothetical protein